MAKARSIFEDVTETAKPAPKGGMIDTRPQGARRAMQIWLGLIFALLVAMIAVGGLTRLTDSGLSITEWKPVTGAIPPLNPADWEVEFSKYQASPQFQILNHGMDLAEFKAIFWWEWGHRQLGRVIGLVWAVGFAGFALARKLPVGWSRRLWILGALGGLQGAIGWWMVSSGLTGQMTSVASYRLAVHLGLAFIILGTITWYVLQLGRREADLLQARRAGEPKLFGMSTGLMHMAFLQILLGALVAGIDAGRAFPTWPDMNGQFFPADAFYVPGRPLWAAFFENPGLVQFIHRMVGYAVFAFGIVTFLKARRSAHPLTQQAFLVMAVMLLAQVALGIFTVLHAAPLHLGLTHQLGAVLLWVLIIRARFNARYPVVQSIRRTK
jgi:heme a synthase